MKDSDSFEEMLRRQQVKAAPDSWRAEILGAAQSAMTGKELKSRPATSHSRFVSVRDLLVVVGREILYPSRRAWGVLAAAWALILLLTLLNHDSNLSAVASSNSVSPLAQKLLKEQARLLVEYSSESSEAIEPRRPDTRPRSEQSPIWTKV